MGRCDCGYEKSSSSVCSELVVTIIHGALSRDHVHMFVEIAPHNCRCGSDFMLAIFDVARAEPAIFFSSYSNAHVRRKAEKKLEANRNPKISAPECIGQIESSEALGNYICNDPRRHLLPACPRNLMAPLLRKSINAGDRNRERRTGTSDTLAQGKAF